MREPKRRRGLPSTAYKTLSRRSLLDWMGKATVLALGGEVLAACGPSGGVHGLDGGLLGDGGSDGSDGSSDTGADGDSTLLGDTGTDGGWEGGLDADRPIETDPWGFHPPNPEPDIYATWPVRTVDNQELESILATWQFTVDGLVETPITLTFLELLELTRQDQITDFHCVEGWSVFDVPWNGVHLSTLLDLVGPQDGATYVTFHTIDSRYNESLPLDVALEPHTLLAYGVDDHTLPLDHGFPLRLVVPRLYAYKSAKYVNRIELTDVPIEGFWVRAGYPYSGEVPEVRLRPGRY